MPARYTYFVEKVRTYREEGLPLEEAIDGAIADCIKGHILEEFFEKRNIDGLYDIGQL